MIFRFKLFAAVWLLCCACTAFGQEAPEGRLMRFPDIHGDKIVFSYAGDIWLAPSAGGVARRVTTHPGLELFPKFSPDGKWIAFTAQYDGNSNVYVMPAEGGQPKQLTFHWGGVHESERMGPDNEVLNWFPDSKRILFMSRRDTYNTWFGRPYVVSIDGGLPTALPIDKGGLTSFSPDGSKMAYNRIFRNFRTWKRYQGGMAQDIWIYDFKANQIEQMPHEDWTDTFPMWHGDTIYFSSDRGAGHRFNLYSYSLKTKQIRQLTNYTEYDVMWPSLGPDSIVFENGGFLNVFDLSSEKAHKVNVSVPGDLNLARKHWTNVEKFITDFDISPEGKRGVFTSRGEIFTVPAKEGSIRNITSTPGIREHYATWSPDGKWIAYISDRSGEDELYLMPQDGSGKEVRVTADGKMVRLEPVWSPDSKKLLFADKSVRLFYVDVDTKQPVLIDQGKYSDFNGYSWSPDSQWVAYSNPGESGYGAIDLYSLADRKITPVTSPLTNNTQPVFDPEGKYLYFFSDRDFNEVLGNVDAEFANPKTTRVYLLTLRADLPSPFAPQSDESGAKKSEKAAPPKEPAKEESKSEGRTPPKDFRIDLAGIESRIVALPIPPNNMRHLDAAKDRVFYATLPIFGLSGPLAGESPAIHVFDLNERKDQVLMENASAFALSFDGTKLLYAGQGAGSGPSAYGIIDAKVPTAPAKVGDGALSFGQMNMEVDPHAEWNQIFGEVWRQERDYFFEPSMNGVDWARERERYAPLLPYVGDRYDLTYVLGEMIGELSNSHTYVGGGDYPDLKPVNVGLLGADLETDAEHGLYRIKKIYPGENWDASRRSPLTEPGVNVKQGDYLLAVNGHSLRVPQNPYELLVNTVGQNVILTVNSKPGDEGTRQVTVKPIDSEFGLHELNMIETNRRKVEEASGGHVGYVYLPDMGESGLSEFVKQYFPQIRKEGIIFDVRYNGGGFVDQIIFERLRRVLAGMDSARNWEPGTVPDNVFHGAMVCITNHYAASDGDFFSYYFKYYKLGPLIGERTWGGVRGIRGTIPLMDGGYVTRPEFSFYGLDSKWLVENHGVEPDIEVDNRPDLVMKGQDPQLEKAIELVMKEMKEHPKKLPPRPPDLPAYPPKDGAH